MEQEQFAGEEMEMHLAPALQSVSQLQEILETSRLSRGMFLRLVVAFEEEESVAAAFAKRWRKSKIQPIPDHPMSALPAISVILMGNEIVIMIILSVKMSICTAIWTRITRTCGVFVNSMP